MPLATTEQWRKAISAQFRYPGHAKIDIDLTPMVEKGNVTSTSQDTFSMSSVDAILDGVESAYPAPVTMEGSWKADGSQYLLSPNSNENQAFPWWAETAGPAKVVFDFGENVEALVGFTVVWDLQYNSWPTLLRIKGYNIEGVEKYNYLRNSIDTVISTVVAPMDNIQIVTFDILGWSHELYRPRITEVTFGVTLHFVDSDIITISQLNSIEWGTSELPRDSMDFSLKNQIYRQSIIQGGAAQANQSSPIVNISRILNGSAENDGPVSTMEVMYWRSDGSQYLLSSESIENKRLPWMSATTDFSKENPIEITITYVEPVALNQINITWDNVTNSWPYEYKLVGYDSLHGVVFDHSYIGNGVSVKIDDDLGTVKYVKLYIYSWNHQGWRARISQFEALFMYGNNNIPSEVNNLFDPTLTTSYSKYLAMHQQVHLTFGQELTANNTEWLPSQSYFLRGWKIPTDAIEATFECGTRLSFLDIEFTKGLPVVEEKTFYDAALYILQNSNIIRLYGSETPWELPDSLKEFKTSRPLGLEDVNVQLQLIANASGHILDTNPANGYVRFRKRPDVAQYVIGKLSQQESPAIELTQPLKSLAVNVYTYSIKDEEETVFEGKISFKGSRNIRVTYSNSSTTVNCVATVTGATLISATYYAQGAELYMDTQSEEPVEVSIKIVGKQIESQYFSVEYYSDDHIKDGEEIEIDNPFITNTNTAKALADYMLEYYLKRQYLTTTYLGYPDLRASDVVGIYSEYLNGLGTIMKHTLDYNGGYSGSIEAVMSMEDEYYVEAP